MGSFSIWHWVIVLFFVGMIVLIVRTGRKKVDPVKGPVGFGGWLLLLALWQTLAPLRTLAEVAGGWEQYKPLQSIPGGQFVVTAETLLNFGFIALQVVVLWSMFKQRTSFPRLFMYQWLAVPAIFVLDAMIVSGGLGIGINQVITQDLFTSTLGAFIGFGLWTWYVFKSVRVKNTFVH